MKKRLLTSFYIALVLALALFSRIHTSFVFDLLIGALAVAGIVEVARVFERIKRYNSVHIAAIIPALVYIAFFIGFIEELTISYYVLAILVVFILVYLSTLFSTLLLKNATKREMTKYGLKTSLFDYAMNKAVNTSLLLVYPTILFASLFLLNNISKINFSNTTVALSEIGNFFTIEIFFLVLAFVITIATDTFAMFVGMLIKGKKLCPIISPNKTISGAIGGLFGGVIASLLLYLIFATNASFALAFEKVASVGFIPLIGLFGAVFCQIGDIFASYLKRKARVKDYGTIFPGHGGVMDRVDGLIFSSLFVTITVVVILSITIL